MRFHEIKGGLLIPVSLEEQDLLDRMEEEGHLSRPQLNERETELVRKMVSRGVVDRVRIEDTVYYVANKLDDLWRD